MCEKMAQWLEEAERRRSREHDEHDSDAIGRNQSLLLRSAQWLQLTFALQGGTERLTWLDINQRNRQAGACVLRALSGVVHSEPIIRIAGKAGVERTVSATDHIDEIHEPIVATGVP
jgi:hypothetical protein